MASLINSDNGVSSGSAGLKSSADSSGVLQLQTNGTAALTVDTSQNVGIGTASPTQKLNVIGNLGVGTTGVTIGAGREIYIDCPAASTGALDFSVNGTLTGYLSSNSTSTNLYTYGASPVLLFGTNNTERMRIDSSGNLNLGQTSGSYRFNASAASAANGVVAQFTNSGSTGCGIDFNQTGVDDFALTMPAGAGGLRFIASGSNERMRIDSSGNLVLNNGTTTSYAKLTVNSADGDQLALNNAGTQYTSMYFRNNGTLKTSVYWDNTNTKYVVQLTLGGVQLVNNTTAWAAISDTRLKNITGIYTNALDDIQQIEAIKFTWKSDESNRPQVGVTAQSVQKVIPEAIDIGTINNEDDTQYLSVRYTEIIPLMIAAIQEQQALITQLQADVAALKGAQA